jgi:hypothetical protein
VADYFAPPNPKALDKADSDLGSGGALLVPDQPGPKPHLLIGGGKNGILYVVNRDNMGHSNPKRKNAPQAVPNPGHAIFSSPAYFDGMVYMNAVSDVLKQYRLINGTLVGPVAQSSTPFGYPGATPSISADGASNGIVWEVQNSGTRAAPGPAVLHAYNADNVAQELYNSAQDSPRDQAGLAVKFVVPTIANGKVYVGTQTGLTVYGLLG